MFQTDVVKKIKRSFLCPVAVYEIKWKNIVELGRP
jgi:hypothetical protein